MVSNREPYRPRMEDGATGWKRTTGGLVSALEPLVRRRNGTWIAWSPGAERRIVRSRVPGDGASFAMLQVPLSSDEVERYYEGFANGALWPLFHSFVDRCRFECDHWEEYRRINERFADVLVEEADDEALVWIHDYHFCLLPRLARERGCSAPIAYFCHIPFPAPEIFQLLPWRRAVLAGLLGADLIGFHCISYARHFVASCRQFLGADVSLDGGTVVFEGRRSRVVAAPIGIEVQEFESLSRDPAVVARSLEIRERLGAEKVILGVDRLDYTKGIAARLQAIDELFERHPEHRRRVTFVQVAVRSRSRIPEYQETKQRVDELVGRINGGYGDAEWQPIRYSNDGLEREELVAYYLACDVCLVTPLRDGMNLVALEFCACRTQEDGVLVLSEFAGASELLDGAALTVNPYAVHEMAEALHQSIVMPHAEQERRMRRARRRVTKHDVHHWVEEILSAVPRRRRRLVEQGMSVG
ncbi:MAG TPA: trehalose-6-phosphate synthase [Thermoanaerobaculia bacterium]|nr:trehalose-6-phosphate synthase [Thermoanaerobaculia bacterium]